jgi:DNA invertase Pin-like site-specific DNA recombinase
MILFELMQVLGYGRVSSEEQAIDSRALEKQLMRLRAAGANKIFYDVGKRTNDKRKGINQLIKYIEASSLEEIQTLIFTRLDRISASIVLFYQLVEVCKAKKIKLEALDDAIDLDSVGGEFSADVRVLIAKHEVKMLSLRVRKDLETRKNNKKPSYRPPFGFKVGGENYDYYEFDTTPLICLLDGSRELTAVDIAKMRVEAFFECGSVRSATKQMNSLFGMWRIQARSPQPDRVNIVNAEDDINSKLWSKASGAVSNGLFLSSSGLSVWLTNPVIAGGTVIDKTVSGKKYSKPRHELNIHWGTHEGIISVEQREQILSIFATNKSNRWATSDTSESKIFSGLVYCAHCGSKMTINGTQYLKKSQKHVSYFQCLYYRNNGTCTNKTMISSIELENQVIPLLVREAERLSLIGVGIVKLEEPLDLIALKQQLRQLEGISGRNTSIEKAIAEIREDILLKTASLAHVQTEWTISRDRVIKAFANPEFWDSIDSHNDKKRLLDECVREIKVDGCRVLEIKYRHRT